MDETVEQPLILFELEEECYLNQRVALFRPRKNISKEFGKIHSNVPWRAMSGMRDKLIHDYVGIDFDVVWETIKEDMPILEDALKDL